MTCNEALTNGGFESGTTPWVAAAGNGHAIVSTTRPHTGTHSALLGGYKLSTGRWEDGIELLLVALATASLRHAISRKLVAPGRSFLEDHD